MEISMEIQNVVLSHFKKEELELSDSRVVLSSFQDLNKMLIDLIKKEENQILEKTIVCSKESIVKGFTIMEEPEEIKESEELKENERAP